MFSDIKKSVDLGHTMDPIGQESDLSNEKATLDPKESLQQELLKRLSAEKHRLAAEMEIKFKEASIKRIKEQEQKYKQILAEEKNKYEKALKEKYNRVIKSMLNEREEKIASDYKQTYSNIDAELRQEIDNLKQQLAQKDQQLTLQVAEARIAGKQEQEKASRAFYDNLIQSSKNDIAKQTEEKLQAEFLRNEIELKREHEINLKKHTAKLMNTYEEKLRDALYEQEQALIRSHNEQTARQSELFTHRIQQEVEAAVAAATSKMELEFVKEKQALNAIIENLRPEVEANRVRMRVEVEKEVREEFEIKYAQYKQKIEQAKTLELEALLAAERQRIAEAMQEENMVVLRYKEREIREGCTAELQKDIQTKIQQNLQEQEARLRAEHQQQLEALTKKLQNDHALQLQAEVIQERARVGDKATNEKKILLQQQQANLQEQFASELAHKLAMQAQNLQQQHQIEIRNLEAQLQMAQNQQGVKHAYEQAVAVTQKPVSPFESTLEDDVMLVPAAATRVIEIPADTTRFEQEKQLALRALEQKLRAEFAQEMRAVKANIPQVPAGIDPQEHEQALIECEQRLRREFQAILEQQRMQAATNFAKQRDTELRGTVARYKQKLLNEMEMARTNDLAAAEEALKQQYEARIHQHAELSRVEVERAKEQLQAEHAEKIRAAVALQIEVVEKEQERKFLSYAQAQDEKLKMLVEEERKKLGVKFAQDKANLIKDLTAKFTREKHIAMNKYETELREKLYKEMVKQKDFIQSKYTQTQEAALLEQKRRLEAQHKHEIERIKQGFFDPVLEAPKRDEVLSERNVEILADKILAKFQK